jgi:transposase
MDRDEYHAALRALGWSARELARQLGRSESTVGNWHKPGREDGVPSDVADWLRRLVAARAKWLASNPPPG